MRFDKKLYICMAPFLGALLLVSFIGEKFAQNVALAFFSGISAIFFLHISKKRATYDIHKRQAALTMAAISIIIITVFFLTGFKFGFRKSLLKPAALWQFVLPYGLIVVSTEILRSVFLAQKSKFVLVISYLALAWIDFLILCDVNVFAGYEYFMDALGLAFLPALASNLLYHYVAGKFGALPNIVYKLIIFLFPYVIPYEPQLSDALVSLFRNMLPVGILWLMHALYTPRSFAVAKRSVIAQRVFTAVMSIFSVCYIMLVSMQFQYKMVVVATGSMSGAIEKGDAVIYEEYDDQTIEVGDVIVFADHNSRIIHRVMDIKKINGQLRYVTKGDANEGMDSGYITDEDILGVIHLRIKCIGYPTLWIRSLFE